LVGELDEREPLSCASCVKDEASLRVFFIIPPNGNVHKKSPKLFCVINNEVGRIDLPIADDDLLIVFIIVVTLPNRLVIWLICIKIRGLHSI
jgi:hypothetical protein